MKIEHWHCQTRYPAEQLDYGNLLGACLGGQGKPPKFQHCDTRKGDQEFSRNAANRAQNIEALIAFLDDGAIESSDATLNDELNSVLNLNLLMLKRNRKAALDQFTRPLAGRGTLTKTQLQRELQKWSTIAEGSQLAEYCQVVVYSIKKRLARC